MTANVNTVSLVIAALGGEGGGVLTDWIVSAATEAGLPVQSTSIPGVAQRTGATTYYIEIFPQPLAASSARWPVMGLYPKPGNLDILVASELLEAGRGLANGWITPDRTVLIASTHRHYAIGEKSAMGDGRFDLDAIRAAAQELANRTVLGDFQSVAQREGTIINAVLLGAIAATGKLPLTADQLASSIRNKGIAVDASLAGFNAGFAVASGETAPVANEIARADVPVTGSTKSNDRISALPTPVREFASHGVARLIDYQDEAYAALYLDRLERINAAEQAGTPGNESAVTAETARHMALWMSYEDIIRVADLKTRATRRERVRDEVKADSDAPVHVTDFFKPGADEIADILPVRSGLRLRSFAAKRRKPPKIAMRVRTDTITGFVKLWFMGRQRKRRPASLRYSEEQALIERWLDAIERNLARGNGALAREIVSLATLNKGYGETFHRGRNNFLRILERLVDPSVADASSPAPDTTARLRSAREAALADPDGDALNRVLV